MVAYLQLADAVPFVAKDTLIVDKVEQGDFHRKVRGTGVFAPREVTWVTSEVDGIVEKVFVKPGNTIEPGEPLLQLFNRQLLQKVEEASLELNVTKDELTVLRGKLTSERLNQESALAQAKTAYLSNKLQMDSEAELAKINIIPRVVFERTQLKVKQDKFVVKLEETKLAKLQDSFDAQIRAQEAKVALLDNVLTARQKDVNSLLIVADRKGVVQELTALKGQNLLMGSDVARIVNMQDLIVEIQVPEALGRELQIGQQAKVDTRSEWLSGKVIRVDPKVTNGTIQVDIAMTEPLPAGVRPDLSVDAEIAVETLQNVLFVKKPAATAPGSSGFVFKLNKNGHRAARTQVQFGKASSSAIQVLEGLQPGDQIILTDMAQWFDNIELKLTE
ncbi:efflux RND transporter periplasmic adaptor subunit [Rheinheimera sp. SA_1]|uniref:efflux RND transporter periplasmic adaptor subunit n=1 Tax=Rheinheimera sp. SA_1 TaxID=1827365 RepID=UPI0018D2EB4B|nr:efflux RND transporter periplasmic adaptor subunit [Rheinheimera sp. SA_1]